jgi:hypothetical protein
VSDGGYEYNLVLLAVVFAITELGPGAVSVDEARGKRRAGTAWALAQLAAGALGSTAAIAFGARRGAEAEERGAEQPSAAPQEPRADSEQQPAASEHPPAPSGQPAREGGSHDGGAEAPETLEEEVAAAANGQERGATVTS